MRSFVRNSGVHVRACWCRSHQRCQSSPQLLPAQGSAAALMFLGLWLHLLPRHPLLILPLPLPFPRWGSHSPGCSLHTAAHSGSSSPHPPCCSWAGSAPLRLPLSRWDLTWPQGPSVCGCSALTSSSTDPQGQQPQSQRQSFPLWLWSFALDVWELAGVGRGPGAWKGEKSLPGEPLSRAWQASTGGLRGPCVPCPGSLPECREGIPELLLAQGHSQAPGLGLGAVWVFVC